MPSNHQTIRQTQSREAAAQKLADIKRQAQLDSTSTDLSDLIEHFEALQNQLNQVQAGLTHSHRLTTLGTLAAIVAHEYHNILTPMMTYAQLALAQPEDTALMHKAVQKALSGAERATRISSSLLGFARDDAGQPCAPLRATIDEALTCLARDPKKDGIELVINVPDLTVAMPALNLEQVLINLILNACKAMNTIQPTTERRSAADQTDQNGRADANSSAQPDAHPSPSATTQTSPGTALLLRKRRSGKLTITGQTVTDPDTQLEKLELTITDTGPGIPPALMEHLFEPFVTQPTPHAPHAPHTPPHSPTHSAPHSAAHPAQPANPTPDAHAPRGTGLGLCICRDLINAVGGTITAHNQTTPDTDGTSDTNTPGTTGGATFVLHLPIA